MMKRLAKYLVCCIVFFGCGYHFPIEDDTVNEISVNSVELDSSSFGVDTVYQLDQVGFFLYSKLLLFQEDKDHVEAIRFADSLISIANQSEQLDSVNLLSLKGFSLGELGRIDQQELIYLSMIEIAPRNINGYLDMAFLCNNQKRYNDVIFYIDKVIELEPNDPGHIYKRAHFRKNMEDGEGAFHDYKSVEEYHLEDEMFYEGLSLVEIMDIHDTINGCIDLIKAQKLGSSNVNEPIIQFKCYERVGDFEWPPGVEEKNKQSKL